jgi:hypothetical protein
MRDLSVVKQPVPQILYCLSCTVAVLIIVFSLAGLFFSSILYPTEAIRRTFYSNDFVNLLLCVPVLIASMWFTRRGSLAGLLLWPGVLLTVIYNYVAYAAAGLPLLLTAGYAILIVIDAYVIIQLLTRLNAETIRTRLLCTVHERFTGGLLAVSGLLFFIRAVIQIATFLPGQSASPEAALPTLIADLIITPVWIVGGILLWLKKPAGYVCAPGLLFQASLLFISLLIYFILMPIAAAVPFPASDFAVIAVMSLFFLIPFGLIMRGLIRN